MIPVTIITGFLGAGKTTLLNHLQSQCLGKKRFAIIENEFGEINIDHDLIVGVEDGIFELSNGCICCELNGELTALLQKLLNRRHEFDHLVIETTGMAEPDGVARAFITDPDVQRHFRLDGVIALADANHIEDNLLERPEARKQIAFADHIIINKKSDVDADYLRQIEHEIILINPLATLSATDYAKTSGNILQLNAYETQNVEHSVNQVGAHLAPRHVCDEHCHHGHHHHHSDVAAHSFVFDHPFDFLKFRHWVNMLLMLQGSRIYRIKGVMEFRHQEHKMVLQSVRETHSFQAGKAWGNEPRQSKLVFIGPGLKREAVQKALESCLSIE